MGSAHPRGSSMGSAHPWALLIHGFCSSMGSAHPWGSSMGSAHPRALLIYGLCSSMGSAHPGTLFIHGLCLIQHDVCEVTLQVSKIIDGAPARCPAGYSRSSGTTTSPLSSMSCLQFVLRNLTVMSPWPSSSHKKEVVPEEVTLDDEHVKSEPLDLDNDDTGEGDQDNKDGLHHDLGFDASDNMGGTDDDGNYVDVDPSMLGGGQPQSVEDVVAQAMPGSSGFQGNSFPLWEGDGSLSGFPSEGFSGDSSQARQMGSVMRSSAVTAAAERYLVANSAVGGGGGGSGDSSDALPSTALLRQWQCPYCSKLFIKKFNLLTHVRIHTGERPFACPHCSYRANHSSHLKTHILKVHNSPVTASSSTSAAGTPVVLFSLEKSPISRTAAASSRAGPCLSLSSLSECFALPCTTSSMSDDRIATSKKSASSNRHGSSDEPVSFSSRERYASDDRNDPMNDLFLTHKQN
ncbi:Zinc finger C2H2-type [Trinorchestia longiramus]|nr:Zinc finger C2H2-type [Trinorchestia longiramus]